MDDICKEPFSGYSVSTLAAALCIIKIAYKKGIINQPTYEEIIKKHEEGGLYEEVSSKCK